MGRSSRSWRFAKWGGLALSLLTFTAIFPTGWFLSWYSSDSTINIGAGNGAILVRLQTDFTSTRKPSPGFQIIDGPSAQLYLQFWRYNFWLPHKGNRGPQELILIPIWMFSLAFAIPTVWLFYRDRRRPLPGHCPSCGYDLTGNTTGRCPECGEQAHPATADSNHP